MPDEVASATTPCPGPSTWVEFQLAGEDKRGIPDARYLATLPDGTTRQGKTDAEGLVRIEGIAATSSDVCRLTFPDLDRDAWEPVGGSTAWQPLDTTPQRAALRHRAGTGECVATIAAEYGLLPETIWNAPENEALRERRPSLYVLLADEDEVFVPAVRLKDVTLPLDQRTLLRRKQVPEMLRLRLHDEKHRPRAGLAYLFEVEDVVRQGSTTDDGLIAEAVPPAATSARLTVRDGEKEERYELLISHLEPVTGLVGMQQRLRNLGYDCGPTLGDFGRETRLALRAFQKNQGLSPTGTPDDATLDHLLRRHGS